MAMDLQALTTRQKVMAVVTVVVLLIVVWQVIDLFGGGGKVAPAPARPASPPQRQMSAGAPGGAAMQASPASVAQQQQAVTPVLTQTNVMPTNKDVDAMKQQQVVQKEYLDKLNELQMLKVQREITETNQAIAAAKLATVTADKNMTDLLTKPAAPEVPVGAYAGKLVGPAQVNAPTPPAEVSYVVISVSMQFDKWTAVIGAGGKLYSVNVGDVLPADGSVVASISKQGVVLEKDGKRKMVSLVSSI